MTCKLNIEIFLKLKSTCSSVFHIKHAPSNLKYCLKCTSSRGSIKSPIRLFPCHSNRWKNIYFSIKKRDFCIKNITFYHSLVRWRKYINNIQLYVLNYQNQLKHLFKFSTSTFRESKNFNILNILIQIYFKNLICFIIDSNLELFSSVQEFFGLPLSTCMLLYFFSHRNFCEIFGN